jgi:hypothetical protein
VSYERWIYRGVIVWNAEQCLWWLEKTVDGFFRERIMPPLSLTGGPLEKSCKGGRDKG